LSFVSSLVVEHRYLAINWQNFARVRLHVKFAFIEQPVAKLSAKFNVAMQPGWFALRIDEHSTALSFDRISIHLGAETFRATPILHVKSPDDFCFEGPVYKGFQLEEDAPD